jgi:glycine hydroxymethyltransferase
MTLANAADLFLESGPATNPGTVPLNGKVTFEHRQGRQNAHTPLILTTDDEAPASRSWLPEDPAGRAETAELEQLVSVQARQVFGAHHVDASPASARAALSHVLTRVVEPHDTVMDMWMSETSFTGDGPKPGTTGRWIGYGLTGQGEVDYDETTALAREFRPAVIVCGSGSYPRVLDFARLRAIADDVDALLVADISSVTGLVAAGLYPSPVDLAHVTVAAIGGGLILCGKDGETPFGGNGRTLARRLGRVATSVPPDAARLPGLRAKAESLAAAGTSGFHTVHADMVKNARVLAESLQSLGHRLVSDGTDTHLVLVDLTASGLTGAIVEPALADAGIAAASGRVPGDDPHPGAAGGLLLSSAALTRQGFAAAEFRQCAELIDTVLGSIRR